MASLIAAVQIHPQYAFVWQASRPVCGLYAADVDALAYIRSYHLTAAGLPAERSLRAIWEALPNIAADARYSHTSHPLPILIMLDSKTGAIVERWFATDAWPVLSARLREAA